MADVNYINPSSLDPGVGFKPEGFLGGMEWQKRNQMFNDAQSLQQLMSTVGARKAVGELGEWEQDAPIREAKGLADLATARATTSTIGRQKEAEVTGKELENTGRRTTNAQSALTLDENQATSASRKARAISDNVLALGNNAVTDLNNKTKALQQIAIQTALVGPQAPAALAQQLKTLGIDDAAIQHIVGDGRPETMKKNLKSVMDIMIEADTQAQSHLRGIEMQGKNQLAVQGLANQGSLAVANARAGAAKKTIEQVFATAKTPREAILAGIQLLATPGLDDEHKIMIKQKMRAAETMLTNDERAKLGAELSPTGPKQPQHIPIVPGNGQMAPGDGVRLPKDMSNDELLRALNGG